MYKSDEFVDELHGILDSRYREMSAELGTLRSLLGELRREIFSVKAVHNNEEIGFILQRSESARHELDSLKLELESILPELKSALYQIRTRSSYTHTDNLAPQSASPKIRYEPAHSGPRPDLDSTRESYENEIRILAARYEETRTSLEGLNAEYSSRVAELQVASSELESLRTQKDYTLKELDKLRSEFETIKYSNGSDEIHSIRQEIENTRQELSGLRQEKLKMEDDLDDINSKNRLAKSELAQVLEKVDDAIAALALKNRDISTAKKELEFIDRELALVHEKDEMKKLTIASAKLVEEANKRYADAERELATLRGILAKKQ